MQKFTPTLQASLPYGWEALDLDIFPKNCHPWLSYRGNLTEALKKCKDAHAFSCLSSTQEEIYPEEKNYLSEKNTLAYTRHIVHYMNNIPVVFARTVVSHQFYQLYQSSFKNLGGKPIGSYFLYKNKQIKRSVFEYGKFTTDSFFASLFSNAIPSIFSQKINWDAWPARRSRFNNEKARLMITEVFNPDYFGTSLLYSRYFAVK